MDALIEKEQAEKQNWFWWHWQNLNERKDGSKGSGLRHGRCWFNFDAGMRSSKQIALSWNLWTHFCGVQMDINDEDVSFMLAFPPIAFWLSLSTSWPIVAKLVPRRVLNKTHYPDVIVVDERQCGIRIHSGSVWINPWSKRNDWVKADPWWVRGVNFSINPFEWKFMRHEVRQADGKWALVSTWRAGEAEPDRETFVMPYRYVLKNGTVQDRTATVFAERRAWRPRCLRWTSLFEIVRTCIDVRFDDEVGERSGSWKGGTIGCGYELRAGETTQECLRRMERDRKF